MNNICKRKSEVNESEQILIPYSFSILSFFISATALDLYDRMGNDSELVSPNIIGKIIQSTAQMGSPYIVFRSTYYFRWLSTW